MPSLVCNGVTTTGMTRMQSSLEAVGDKQTMSSLLLDLERQLPVRSIGLSEILGERTGETKASSSWNVELTSWALSLTEDRGLFPSFLMVLHHHHLRPQHQHHPPAQAQHQEIATPFLPLSQMIG